MRLIDADALLKAKWDWCDAEDAIRDAPTVNAVEVVRCKDCINRHTCACPLAYAVDWGIGNELPSDDDYCSCGVRIDSLTEATP